MRGPEAKTAKDELANFTNRVAERDAFQRLLERPEGDDVPVLAFYGVGGVGKSWLIKHARASWLPDGMPSARLDLDVNSGQVLYQNNVPAALAEIRRQLGVECPAFDLAYAMLGFLQGGDQPAMRHQATGNGIWEFVVEGAEALADDVPGANVAAWIVKRVAEKLAKGLEGTAFGEWVQSKVGNDDYLRLRKTDPTDIADDLFRRLGEDLAAALPARHDRACRAVVFLDTFEALKVGLHGDAQEFRAEDWVRRLYGNLDCVLLVVAGRDRIAWSDHESDWALPRFLKGHLVGGLSEHDARDFLTKCAVVDPPLQDAILSSCVDANPRVGGLELPSPLRGTDAGDMDVDDTAERRSQLDPEGVPEDSRGSQTPGRDAPKYPTPEGSQRPVRLESTPRDVGGDRAYHPYSLGLAADAVRVERERGRGRDPDPASFRLRPGDQDALAERFLRSLASGTMEDWVVRLSLTPSFDEAAAKAAYEDEAKDRAWRDLKEFSFVSETEPGWWTLHARMAASLRHRAARDSTQLRNEHETWQASWSARAAEPDDRFAFHAWFHRWQLDPDAAQADWNRRIEEFRRRAQTLRHAAMLDWWTPILIEMPPGMARASVENDLAVELIEAVVGDQKLNLERAIGLCESALRVRTEEAAPRDWATTQNNLGLALTDLPTGDRAANLAAAGAIYRSILRVYTEKAAPLDWAMTQNNLGNALSGLLIGDPSANLAAAVEAYHAALRVYTEEAAPLDWAMVQNNLGAVLKDLPTGDRSANLAAAIEAYHAALRVRTEEASPLQWAETQNNLGAAFGDLPTGDRAANLETAVAAYRAALRVYTEMAAPLDWAMTQFNLALVWIERSVEEPEALMQGEAALRATLRVWTEAGVPLDWADVHWQLSKIFAQRGDEAARLGALQNAERGYRAVGYAEQAEECRRLIAEIEASD